LEFVVSAPRPSLGTLEPLGGGDPIPLLKDRLRLGRRESNDICLAFSNISNTHCELVLEQGYWKVRDLGSRNGVKVNGERITEKRVYPGDEVTFAKHRFRLEYTPTTARSVDAEVDELHEDIMRFSLLERAGLAKKGDRSDEFPRRPMKPKSGEDAAMDYLNIPVARADQGDEDESDHRGKSSLSLGEESVESIPQSKEPRQLSDDDFLKMISEDTKKKPPHQKT
jgi:pSer/pThr/pTyr-binding forkhead associated (FHA) protein